MCSLQQVREVGSTFAREHVLSAQQLNSRLLVLIIVINWQADVLLQLIMHRNALGGQVTVASWQELSPEQLTMQSLSRGHVRSCTWQADVLLQSIIDIGSRAA